MTKRAGMTAATFERYLSEIPGAEPRKMFGCPVGFHRGLMFTGVYQGEVFVRLSVDDRRWVLEKLGGKPFAPGGGNGMREYAILPGEIVESEIQLREWLGRSVAFVRTLPPKVAKSRKKKT